MLKMIVTDLDDTLLRSDKTISDYTLKVLREAQKKGIVVAFATARSESVCNRFIGLVKPDAVISGSGAVISFNNAVIYKCFMDKDTTNELLSLLLNHPGVGSITVDTDIGFFVNRPLDNPDSDYHGAKYTDFREGLPCGSYKITPEIFDDKTINEILAAFPTVGATKFSGENWVRFADKTANKFEGIKILAAHIGINLKDIAAFGDDYSDIEMIRGCGFGIAVSNAIKEVKAVSDHVCGSNDNDGAAKWLEGRI